jgi:hypothetical protein
VRGVIVEANALDDFRENAAPRLVAELDALLSEPASSTVERVREVMVREPQSVQRRVSMRRWLTASGTRLDALRRLERDTAGELAATASADLDAARASADPRGGRVAGRAHLRRRPRLLAEPLDHAPARRGLRGSTDAVGRTGRVGCVLPGPRRDRGGRGGVSRAPRHD